MSTEFNSDCFHQKRKKEKRITTLLLKTDYVHYHSTVWDQYDFLMFLKGLLTKAGLI